MDSVVETNARKRSCSGPRDMHTRAAAVQSKTVKAHSAETQAVETQPIAPQRLDHRQVPESHAPCFPEPWQSTAAAAAPSGVPPCASQFSAAAAAADRANLEIPDTRQATGVTAEQEAMLKNCINVPGVPSQNITSTAPFPRCSSCATEQRIRTRAAVPCSAADGTQTLHNDAVGVDESDALCEPECGQENNMAWRGCRPAGRRQGPCGNRRPKRESGKRYSQPGCRNEPLPLQDQLPCARPWLPTGLQRAVLCCLAL